METTKDKTKFLYREKKLSPSLLRHKMKGTRLNFTLVNAMLSEMGDKKRSKKKMSVFTLLSAKMGAANKIDRCCAKQDFHLLHFQESFFRTHKELKGLFQWKIARYAAKKGLSAIAKQFERDVKRHWRIQHLTEELDKEEKEVQKDNIFDVLNHQREERQYLLTRITSFFIK
ncbi:MAG: hypothetical protein SP1CHLAM54_06980 [Chlamydiia bacterium]|nr:hypothetical protein [Chlamydiia bacterium]MCH9615604.1 hypothetical protein [Chlamydiia bacterium]MCH9628993.1 hypothetical protein [Chlamydiia bacterium]